MVFNATFNNISVIPWRSVLLVEEPELPRENHRSVASSLINKGNNKITEHRAIFQRKRQNSQVNKQTKSVNNRKTGKTAIALTWYRHFQRNGGLNQILRRQTSRFHYGCHYNSIFNNTRTN